MRERGRGKGEWWGWAFLEVFVCLFVCLVVCLLRYCLLNLVDLVDLLFVAFGVFGGLSFVVCCLLFAVAVVGLCKVESGIDVYRENQQKGQLF